MRPQTPTVDTKRQANASDRRTTTRNFKLVTRQVPGTGTLLSFAPRRAIYSRALRVRRACECDSILGAVPGRSWQLGSSGLKADRDFVGARQVPCLFMITENVPS